MQKKNNYRIIGVDFDGTLAVTRGTYPRIQGPIPEVIEYVLSEQKKRCLCGFNNNARRT